MEVRIAQNKVDWDAWLNANCVYARVLQSWEWGEVLKNEGKRVERFEVIENGAAVGVTQVIYNRMPLHGPWYAFSPRGPVIKKDLRGNEKKVEEIYVALGNFLKMRQCIFFRCEPQIFLTDYSLPIVKTIDINPRATTILDLSKTNESLLSNMIPKTRYNIHLAERKNLRVTTEKDLKIFLDLSHKTSARDDFRLHSTKHYKAVLESPLSYQITVWLENEPVAAAVFLGFGNKVTYLFGASNHAFRKYMAPHLVQWEGIQMARRLGYRYYDFFGVAPNTNEYGTSYDYSANHQYAGVTRFKLGFGGKVVEDPGTFDLIIWPFRYRIYQVLRTLRRFI